MLYFIISNEYFPLLDVGSPDTTMILFVLFYIVIFRFDSRLDIWLNIFVVGKWININRNSLSLTARGLIIHWIISTSIQSNAFQSIRPDPE